MARDYRYGHKKKSVATRRSQEGGIALEAQSPVSASNKSAPLTAAAKRRSSTVTVTPAPPELVDAIEAPTPAPPAPPELVAEPEPPIGSAKKRNAKKRSKSKLAEDSEITKKKEEVSPPPSVEVSSDSGPPPQDNDSEDEEPVTKKRFFWLKATGLLVLLVTVTGWLVYAPLILAFALKMGWIDEDTRIRWDSREARQPQIAFVEKVLPMPSAVELDVPKKVESNPEPDQAVNFTFYEELPKAGVELSAQPLPVKTRAPTYLQLSAFSHSKDANEERSRLAQKGYLAQITPQVSQSGKPTYVLRMGPYDDQRVINRLKVELQKLGVDAKEITMTAVIRSQEKSQERLQEKLSEKSNTPK